MAQSKMYHPCYLTVDLVSGPRVNRSRTSFSPQCADIFGCCSSLSLLLTAARSSMVVSFILNGEDNGFTGLTGCVKDLQSFVSLSDTKGIRKEKKNTGDTQQNHCEMPYLQVGTHDKEAISALLFI